MSQTKALALTFIATIAACVSALLILASLGAGDDILALAYLLVLCGGALASSSVVMHYASKRRGR